MKFPKRWQDCTDFLEALLQRSYVNRDDSGNISPIMSDGVYLYMYELWQDGSRNERARICTWLNEEAPSLPQHPAHLANAIEVLP